MAKSSLRNSPKRRLTLRALSLSPLQPALQRQELRPPLSKTAPSLPRFAFQPQDDDMNGSARNHEEAINSVHSAPPRPFDTATMPVHTSTRNVSGPLAIDTPMMSPDQSTSPWGRSNAQATPNSKTGQYIDKITSENDRLRRELRAEKLAREEEAKRLSAARSKAEDSRAEYQHLQLLADTNARALERKDRKMKEMEASLELEAKRRKMAEQRAEEALKLLGDARSANQRELASAYELKIHAESNADAARDGFKRIVESYERKLKVINEQLNELRKQRIEDADKIKRQAIISDQLQHELTRTQRTESKMVDMMGTYKREHRKEMDGLLNEAQQMRITLPEREKEATALVENIKDTRDKMKWVMTQKQRQDAGN